MEYGLFLIPVIGFVIGYFTNYLAVKMLFYPKKSIFGFQGVLPKRRKELAKRISEATIEIMPKELRRVEKIPVIGSIAIDYFKKSVERKVDSLSLDELENLILKTIKREMRFIVWMGGVLGFLIGLIEVLIFL